MAAILYQELSRGVYCAREKRVITRKDRVAWAAYMAWLAAGNEPAALLQVDAARDIEAENRPAQARRQIARLEAAQQRPLRELAIGTAEQRAAAITRLRDIEAAIVPLRLQLSSTKTTD